jgi:hypothetical protein
MLGGVAVADAMLRKESASPVNILQAGYISRHEKALSNCHWRLHI